MMKYELSPECIGEMNRTIIDMIKNEFCGDGYFVRKRLRDILYDIFEGYNTVFVYEKRIKTPFFKPDKFENSCRIRINFQFYECCVSGCFKKYIKNLRNIEQNINEYIEKINTQYINYQRKFSKKDEFHPYFNTKPFLCRMKFKIQDNECEFVRW